MSALIFRNSFKLLLPKLNLINNVYLNSIKYNNKVLISINQTNYYCNIADKNKNNFVAPQTSNNTQLDQITYESICNETLESICEYFDDLVDECKHLRNADVTYSDGVLTVNFGNPYGTYVINRQTPNKQIWLSSPISGPKRYDFVSILDKTSSTENDGYWIYKHEGVTLHELLQNEISPIAKKDVHFLTLPFGSRN